MNMTKAQLAEKIEKLNLEVWRLQDQLGMMVGSSERKAHEVGLAAFDAGAKAARAMDCQLLRMLSSISSKCEDEFRAAELIINGQKLPTNPQATLNKEVRRP